MSLPIPTAWKTELKLGAGTHNDAIEIVSSPADANYLLVGAVRNGRAEYAWVLPNAVEQRAGAVPLPVRSFWFPTNTAADLSAERNLPVDLPLKPSKGKSSLEKAA